MYGQSLRFFDSQMVEKIMSLKREFATYIANWIPLPAFLWGKQAIHSHRDCIVPIVLLILNRDVKEETSLRHCNPGTAK